MLFRSERGRERDSEWKSAGVGALPKQKGGEIAGERNERERERERGEVLLFIHIQLGCSLHSLPRPPVPPARWGRGPESEREREKRGEKKETPQPLRFCCHIPEAPKSQESDSNYKNLSKL